MSHDPTTDVYFHILAELTSGGDDVRKTRNAKTNMSASTRSRSSDTSHATYVPAPVLFTVAELFFTATMDPTRCAGQLERLRQYLSQCGGSANLINGWQCVEITRSRGNSAGTTDRYFQTAQGKRFRSQADVARHFGLIPSAASAASSRKRSLTTVTQSTIGRQPDTSTAGGTAAAAAASQSTGMSSSRSSATTTTNNSSSSSLSPDRRGAQQPRGIVIGQAPPMHTDPAFVPLSGLPEQRLARLAGWDVGVLWQRFERRNLLEAHPGRKFKAEKHQRENGYKLHQSTGDAFPKELAKDAAASIDLRSYGLAVLLGLQVAQAFGVQPKLLKLDMTTLPCPAIVLPHTSGVSHFWNDGENVANAELAFRDAIAQCLGTKSRFFS